MVLYNVLCTMYNDRREAISLLSLSLLSDVFFFSLSSPTRHSLLLLTPHSLLLNSICPGKAVGDYEESAAFPWWADLLVRG